WRLRSYSYGILGRAGAVHFFLEHTPDLELELAKERRHRQLHQIARMRKRHVDDLLDAAGMRRHHRDAVTKEQRLVDRMGDIDHGLPCRLPDAYQLFLQDGAVLRIERGERLVHIENRRIGDESAGDGAALAHAARELMREVLAEVREADEAHRPFDPRRALGRGHTARHQSEADILLDRHPGKEAAVLEHHRVLDPPAGAVDQDGAGALLLEAGENAQQGRLAAARRPDDAEEFAGLDLQIDRLNRLDAPARGLEDFAQAGDLDLRSLARGFRRHDCLASAHFFTRGSAPSISTKQIRQASLPRLTQAWLVACWTSTSPAFKCTSSSSRSMSISPESTIA